MKKRAPPALPRLTHAALKAAMTQRASDQYQGARLRATQSAPLKDPTEGVTLSPWGEEFVRVAYALLREVERTRSLKRKPESVSKAA